MANSKYANETASAPFVFLNVRIILICALKILVLSSGNHSGGKFGRASIGAGGKIMSGDDGMKNIVMCTSREDGDMKGIDG